MTDIEKMKYWLIMNEEEKVNTGLAPRYSFCYKDMISWKNLEHLDLQTAK